MQTLGGSDARERRRELLQNAADTLNDKTGDATARVDAEKSTVQNSRLGWLRKRDDLLKMMKERTSLTPSLLFIRMEFLGL